MGCGRTEYWVNRVCGLVPVRLNLLDKQALWMWFVSEEEAELSRSQAATDIPDFPFYAIKRWTEVLGHPLHPRVRMRGVPLHIWRKSVFRKIGDCLASTLEVDQATISQENL